MGRKVWVPVVSGPLAPYAGGYGSWLRSRAYSPSAAADRLCQFDQVSRWLERGGLGGEELAARPAGRVRAAGGGAGRGARGSPQSRARVRGGLPGPGGGAALAPARAERR